MDELLQVPLFSRFNRPGLLALAHAVLDSAWFRNRLHTVDIEPELLSEVILTLEDGFSVRSDHGEHNDGFAEWLAVLGYLRTLVNNFKIGCAIQRNLRLKHEIASTTGERLWRGACLTAHSFFNPLGDLHEP